MNQLSEYTTTTATMKNDNMISSLNNLASDSALVSVAIDDIMNCVKSHIALIRWNTS